MPRGSKPGEHRGGRAAGTPNKPKDEKALVVLDQAEAEVRVLIEAGARITALGKDRLTEIDDWAYKAAKRFAPREDKNGDPYWKNPGDEARFDRYLKLSAKCALGRAQFESPRYATVKGERALVKLDAAEREVRVIVAAGEDIAKLGKDRQASVNSITRLEPVIGVHPRRWTDCRLGIDRNLPGFQGWKPWPSTAPTASNSSVRSPWNTLRARPCMRWRSATTCPVILSASGSRSTKLAPSRTTSAQPISCRNTKQRSPLWNAWWGGKRLRSNS